MSPDTLIALNVLIAAGYAAASLLLVRASILGVSYVRRDREIARQPIAQVVGALWVGAALFLVGCGVHHVQHAQHLRDHGCAMGLCGTGAYLAAIAQVTGEVVSILAATLLIDLLHRSPTRRRPAR